MNNNPERLVEIILNILCYTLMFVVSYSLGVAIPASQSGIGITILVVFGAAFGLIGVVVYSAILLSTPWRQNRQRTPMK